MRAPTAAAMTPSCQPSRHTCRSTYHARGGTLWTSWQNLSGSRWWRCLPSSAAGRCPSSSKDSFETAGAGFSENRSLFCFGLGYVGTELAKELLRDGWCAPASVIVPADMNLAAYVEGVLAVMQLPSLAAARPFVSSHSNFGRVSGTVQPGQESEELGSVGARMFVFDPTDGQPLRMDGLNALQNSSHILVTTPPVQELASDPVLFALADELKTIGESRHCSWLGYLSSTGVYGDWEGAWVDESSTPRPANEKLMRRLDVEEQWKHLASTSGLPLRIFRLGGIYGLRRNALLTVKKGSSISESQRRRGRRMYTSRVHVADVCQALRASMDSKPGASVEVYNVVDDDPASRTEVMQYAGALLAEREVLDSSGSPEAQQAVQQRATLLDEKRVDNRKMKTDLGVSLMYPTYREGLQSIASELQQ